MKSKAITKFSDVFLSRKGLLLALALYLTACGPGFRLEEQSQEELVLGPKLIDSNLIQGLNANIHREFRWEGTTNSASYYEVLNKMAEIDRQATSMALQQVIKKAVDAEVTSARSSETDLANGNYFKLLVSKQGPAAVQKLKTMKAELQAGLEKVILKVSAWKIPQVAPDQPLSPVVDKIFGDLQDLVVWMKSESLNESLIQALQDYAELQGTVVPQIRRIDNDTNLASLAQNLLNLIASLKVTLPQTTSQELNSALTLGQMINQMRTSEDALAALVFVWRMLPVNDRYATFRTSNKDLADLFKDSSNKDLDCFAGLRSCGLINYTKKELFVLPGIKSKGVANIRNDLNLQGMNRTRSKIVDMINSKTKDLASTAPALIREKFASATAILDQMMNDFSGTMSSRLKKQQLRESGLNSREFRVTQSQNQFKMTVTSNKPASMHSISAVAGFIPTILRHSSHPIALKESLFLGSVSEAAVDQVDASASTGALSLTGDANLQPKMLAEALENNARLLQAIRKDAAMNFLTRVSNLSAQNLFNETQSPFLQNMKIFPKGALSAIFLGRTAKLLEFLKQENSPVFLISTKNDIVWADKYKGTAASPATGAVIAGGMVGKNHGSRQATVLSADVSRMLSALSQFVEALEGIDSLVADYADAATLRAGRDNARSLAVSFANYLSNHLRRSDGLIVHELNYAQGKSLSNEVHLLDQALAIGALMDARRALGVEIYRWEAVDTYFALNKNMFDGSTGFYRSHLQASSATLPLPEFLTALTGILKVQSALPRESRHQFDRIFTPWINSLEQISLAGP